MFWFSSKIDSKFGKIFLGNLRYFKIKRKIEVHCTRMSTNQQRHVFMKCFLVTPLSANPFFKNFWFI